MILCQSSKVTYTRRKVKGQNGCQHHGYGEEGTAPGPLCLWASSIDELFFIQLWMFAVTVWHVGQSWTEATELYNFMRGKMDLQQRVSSIVMSNRKHLEIYKDKLVGTRDLSHHRNKTQSWAHWDDWVIGVTTKIAGRRTDFQLYIVD